MNKKFIGGFVFGITFGVVILVAISILVSMYVNSQHHGEPSNINQISNNTGEQDNMSKKVLVAYYSAQGHTKTVAEKIAQNLNADTFEIIPQEIYTAEDLDWTDSNSRVSREHEDEDLRDIKLVAVTPKDWTEYDTILIGYPIWWGIAAWPVNNFVTYNDFDGKVVIPFATSASSELGQSGELLKEMNHSGDWRNGHRFSSTPSEDDIKAWTDDISEM